MQKSADAKPSPSHSVPLVALLQHHATMASPGSALQREVREYFFCRHLPFFWGGESPETDAKMHHVVQKCTICRIWVHLHPALPIRWHPGCVPLGGCHLPHYRLLPQFPLPHCLSRKRGYFCCISQRMLSMDFRADDKEDHLGLPPLPFHCVGTSDPTC